jgi:hypothetical protein
MAKSLFDRINEIVIPGTQIQLGSYVDLLPIPSMSMLMSSCLLIIIALLITCR